MEMKKIKNVIQEKLKKLLAAIMAIFMMSSYMGLYANISYAEETKDNWYKYVYSYDSGYNVKITDYAGATLDSRGDYWLFYDNSHTYQNLICIRTGVGHASSYREVDLYKLKEQAPEEFNKLFSEYNSQIYGQYTEEQYGNIPYLKETPEDRYKHILWEIDNFYIFYDGGNEGQNTDTEEDRNRRLTEYNSFVGMELPYGNEETVINNAVGVGGNLPTKQISRYRNEQLIKLIQSDLISKYINQDPNYMSNLTHGVFKYRIADLSNVMYSNRTPVEANVQNFINSVNTKFSNMELSEDYNIAENHYEFNKGNVTINQIQEENPENNKVSFNLHNPYGNHAKITIKEVKINGTPSNNYQVLDENNNPIQNFETFASANENSKFKIQAEDIETVDIILNVDYGDITNAKLLIPNGVGQYLININKEHKQYNISSSGEIERKFDLALTKQITSVKNANNTINYNRLNSINTNPLNEGKNNAYYYMDKNAVFVEKDDTVKYKITIYNEGNVNGFAEEITDYLPEGLTFIPDSELNRKYGWIGDANSRIITTKYLSSNGNENSTNKLYPLSGNEFEEAMPDGNGNRDASKKQSKATVELELKVNEENDGITLDNRAEITKYGYYKDGVLVECNAPNIDRDSKQNSVIEGKTANEITNEIENIVNTKTNGSAVFVEKNSISYQDDDDIERLRTIKDDQYVDLALRKWISAINENVITNREPSQNQKFENQNLELAEEVSGDYNADKIKTTTLKYDNPKEAKQVAPGDLVTYNIAIYNEGERAAYAEQVTDYLPEFLDFVENNEINNEYGWEAVKNVDGTTTVTTDYLSKAKGKYLDTYIDNTNLLQTVAGAHVQRNINKDTRIVPSHKVIKIVCRVNENVPNRKFLTNRAEITKYGYYDSQNNFIRCNEPGIDRDSKEDTIKENLGLDNWYTDKYIPSTPNALFPGDQDDDDFETVQVYVKETSYNLQVKKVDTKGNSIETENITNIFETTIQKSNEQNPEQMQIKNTDASSINYKDIEVNSIGEDVIIIEEKNAPAGYAKFDKKIKIYIDKDRNNNSYIYNISKVEILNSDNSVFNTYSADQFEIKDPWRPIKTLELDEGGKISYTYATLNSLFNLNDGIRVEIENKKIDVALKKSITKVTHNNETKEVTEENGFNVGRKEGNVYINADSTTIENTQNATYTMNKTPVEVNKGDAVEYEIRIFNEGEVDATASIITDYIPVGLKFEKIYYGETELSEGLNVGNTYSYNEQNRELKVFLRDSTNTIPTAYNQENGLQSDYIRVVCSVEPEANGVLTNVAEISEYMYKTQNGIATTNVDIDSTANNWNAPSNDKGSGEWRAYSNEQESKLDGSRHAFISQDSSIANRKGDDDDFDKLVVKGKYEVVINKKNSENENVENVPFTIKRTKTINGESTTETLKNNEASSTFTFEDETSPLVQESIITYDITEGTNANYDQLKNKMVLNVKLQNGKIKEYQLNSQNTQNAYISDVTKEYNFASTMNNTVKVTVNLDIENSKITLNIENKEISTGAYSIKVKKVSAGDENKVLTGVTFAGEKGITTNLKDFNGDTTPYEATTLENGIATIVDNYEITNENFTKWDKYTISEIDLGDTNSSYTKLNTPLSVFVTKKYNERTLQYEIQSWGITKEGDTLTNTAYNKIYNGTGAIYVDEQGLRYVITAFEENGVITINIPNMPEQKTSIKIVKEDKDRPEIKIPNTKLEITTRRPFSSYKEYTNNNGELNLETPIEASTQELNYQIKELEAAPEYDNIFKGKYIDLKLTLSNGRITGIESAQVRDSITGEIDQTLTSPDYFEATINPADDHQVILKMKNKITEKQVDLALKKVITEINGKSVNTANKFDSIYNRQRDSIYTEPLDNGENTATYNLNKTPILVTKGSTIKYQIRIYNESSEINATASEITDYIPNGLKLLKVYYRNSDELTRGTDYTYDDTKHVMKTKILDGKDLISAYIPSDATTGETGTLSKEFITVECKVEDTASGVLTNVAEITQYKTLDRDNNPSYIEQDRDSDSGNWKNPNDSNPDNNETTQKDTKKWIEYSAENEIEEGETKEYPGQEDDDDFEKVVVGEVDLVLKKIITKVGDTTENNFDEPFRRFNQDGTVHVHTDKLNFFTKVTTAEYMLNKTPVPVNVGDVVTYELRIYNEGSIDAAASEIKDYIPKGLDLQKVSYNGMELDKDVNYTIENNVLTIKLENIGLIEKYTGTRAPSFDNGLTVECKVNGDVRGILTNVAEISKYTTMYGETDVDRDSKTTQDGEWKAPDGSNKNTLDGKSGEPWTNYYNIIEQGEFTDYPGQQDDDDFEKIYVQSKYKLKIRKVNQLDNDAPLKDIEFKVNNETFTSNEEGKVFEKEYNLTFEGQSGLEADEFHIEEVSTNNTFDELLREIEFHVRKKKSETGEIYIKECAIDYRGMGIDRGRLAIDGNNRHYTFSTIQTKSGELINLDLYISRENGEVSFEFVIGNKPKVLEYDVFLNKVDSSNNNIDGVKFNVSSNINSFDYNSEITTQGENNLLAQNRVNSNNYNNVDTFEITEIETVKGLIKLPNSLTIEVTKGLTEAKNAYEIKDIKLRYGSLESSKNNNKYVIENIPVGNSNKTVNITAELSEYTKNEGTENERITKKIVITIPNEEIDNGNYKILINKQSNTGNNISGVKFNTAESYGETPEGMNITPQVTTDGTNNPKEIVDYTITKNNYESLDRYSVTEIEAPNGYYKLKDPIGISVKKKLNNDGTAYQLEYFRVNGWNAPAYGSYEISNLELENAPAGMYGKLIIQTLENNTLLIKVVDVEKIGKYEVKLQKVNEDGNNIEGADFEITGIDSEEGTLNHAVISPITTEKESEPQLIVKRFLSVVNKETTDKYEIKEVNAPEGYYKLRNSIKLDITKKYTDSGIEIDKVFVDETEVTNNSITKEVELEGTTKKAKIIVTLENNTIIVKAENILKESNYKIFVNKVDEDNNYLANVKFGITGKDSKNNSLAQNITTPITTDGTENSKQIVSSVIERANYSLIDTYTIEELEVPEGFYKLKNAINVKVEKTINENSNTYEVSKFYVDNTEVTSNGIELNNYELLNAPEGTKVALRAERKGNELTIVVENITKEGTYTIKLNKVDSEGKYIAGATFEITGEDSNKQPLAKFITSSITTDGTENAKQVVSRFIKKADSNTEDIYTIKETNAPVGYYKLKDSISIKVTKKISASAIEIDKVFVNNKEVENGKLVIENLSLEDTDKTVKATITVEGNVITVVIENQFKEFDLSLRKFISEINNSELTGEKSREPKVDLSTLINGKKDRNGEKTATYNHTKEALLVNPSDLVLYTLRIYNEGELDGYASRIIDDVPAGVTMVAPTYDEAGKPTNKNAEYRWKMFKEISETDATANTSKEVLKYANKFYIETDVATEAVLISTDYLSMENGQSKMAEGETVNPNLIKAFNGTELDYKDIKVQFKVKTDNNPDKIITNYAQISNHQYKDGTPILDRDSNPNEWKDGEDDQDIENLKVTWFDLALYKWVSSTIVTEDGKTKEYASGHTQDNKSKLVNVTVAKDKLNSTVVKFKWTIKVENQSPIPGYAKELKDHIPAGLKFVEEDNKEFGWKLQPDGTVTTNYLKDTLLQPAGVAGNTAEVTLVLTWINGENNLGAKVNNAEISKDYNKYGTPDIDSTPNNFKVEPKEDDEDKDEVRLNIKTGNAFEVAYLIIGTIAIAIVAGGVFGIKKYVISGK